jgi:hypothetical protein
MDQQQPRNDLIAIDNKIMNCVKEIKEIPSSLPENVRSQMLAILFERVEFLTDWQVAYDMCKSDIVPKNYVGKPNNAVMAFRLGKALGLDRQQSVQHLYTVNGITRVFGDMMLALCKKSPDFVDCIEEFGELIEADKVHGLVPKFAKCTVLIKDKKPKISIYTIDDARKNPNWGNTTWRTNPKRQMQFRARSFALRDAFPEMVSGVYNEYEFDEIVKTRAKTPANLKDIDIKEKDITESVVDLGKEKEEEPAEETQKEESYIEKLKAIVEDEQYRKAIKAGIKEGKIWYNDKDNNGAKTPKNEEEAKFVYDLIIEYREFEIQEENDRIAMEGNDGYD